MGILHMTHKCVNTYGVTQMEIERVPIFLKYGNDWRKNGATLHHHELTQKMSHFDAKNHEALYYAISKEIRNTNT